MVSRSALLTAKHVRFNSSTAQEPVQPEGTPATEAEIKKQKLREQDKIQKDWDASELTYEELKPRTEQPTPVRYSFLTACHGISDLLRIST